MVRGSNDSIKQLRPNGVEALTQSATEEGTQIASLLLALVAHDIPRAGRWGCIPSKRTSIIPPIRFRAESESRAAHNVAQAARL